MWRWTDVEALAHLRRTRPRLHGHRARAVADARLQQQRAEAELGRAVVALWQAAGWVVVSGEVYGMRMDKGQFSPDAAKALAQRLRAMVGLFGAT